MTAIAGTVRRRRAPAATPNVNANAAYPIGAIPRAPNISGAIRATSKMVPLAPWPALTALSIGRDHHVMARPASAPAVPAPSKPTTSLVASQRLRVMLCDQTRVWVPASSSRATIGAPQKAPITAGTTYATATPTAYSVRSERSEPSCSRKVAALSWYASTR